MLYVVRLMKGDCIIVAASDKQNALEFAHRLGGEDRESVASVRELSRFGVRLSPNEEGSLEVDSWDDRTLDDVLANEYPVLNEAFQAANAVPFMSRERATEPLMDQLKRAHEQNTEIIRKGLRLERQRFTPDPVIQKPKTARKGR